MGRLGVLLLNLGGPDKLEDVRPFLYNLFSDPEIIRLPSPLLQAPLAWLISNLRAKQSQQNYKKIGGGSPLRRITEEQAQALRLQLVQDGLDVGLMFKFMWECVIGIHLQRRRSPKLNATKSKN